MYPIREPKPLSLAPLAPVHKLDYSEKEVHVVGWQFGAFQRSLRACLAAWVCLLV